MLETGDNFQRIAEDLREPYLTYLYDIGQDLDSLHWWLTSLSHRNVHTCKTFHQICYLKTGLDLAESWDTPGPLLLVVADEPVRRALQQNLDARGDVRVSIVEHRSSVPGQSLVDYLRVMARRTFFMFRQSRRLFWAHVMAPRPPIPVEPTTVLISSAHSGNITRGPNFHSYAFGDLVKELRGLGLKVAIAPLVLPDVRYKDALARIQNPGNPLMVPHSYLRVRDLLWAAVSTLSKPPAPHSIPQFARMNISILVNDALRTHWITNQAADALLMVALVRRWADLGASITRVIYVYENQPWERALCWQIRLLFSQAVLVGYQHAAMPRMVLKFFLAPGGESKAPLPHRIVTVGRHTAGLLASGGYETRDIRVGGALQMRAIVDHKKRNVGKDSIQNGPTILVATSVGREEASEAVDLAIRLFSEDQDVQVVLKCHPTLPFHKISGWAGKKLPSHVQISDEPIATLMLRCSVMVYTGSAVCIQAMAMGLPMIHLRPTFDFDMDPLEANTDARLEATGLEQLRERVTWLLKHRDIYVAEHQVTWSRLVEEMYGQVTDESYLAFVE